EDACGFFFGALQPFTPVMMFTDALVHLRQQFLPERFFAQTPAAPDVAPFFVCLRAPPLFHALLELRPARRAVSRDAHFTQEPIHSQPKRAGGTVHVRREAGPAI